MGRTKTECDRPIFTPGMSMHSHYCHKSVEPGTENCKFHNGVDRRRRERSVKVSEMLDKRAALSDQLHAQAEALTKRLGVSVTPHYAPGYRSNLGYYDTRMVIDADFLERAARAREEGDWH